MQCSICIDVPKRRRASRVSKPRSVARTDATHPTPEFIAEDKFRTNVGYDVFRVLREERHHSSLTFPRSTPPSPISLARCQLTTKRQVVCHLKKDTKEKSPPGSTSLPVAGRSSGPSCMIGCPVHRQAPMNPRKGARKRHHHRVS